MKRGLNVFALVAFLLVFQFVFVSADPSVSPSSFSATPGQNSSFTITITNSDTYTDTGIGTNITKVNITLPSEFTFMSETNGTDSASTFSSASSVLSWDNSSYVIGSSTGGDNVETFSFNAFWQATFSQFYFTPSPVNFITTFNRYWKDLFAHNSYS